MRVNQGLFIQSVLEKCFVWAQTLKTVHLLFMYKLKLMFFINKYDLYLQLQTLLAAYAVNF